MLIHFDITLHNEGQKKTTRNHVIYTMMQMEHQISPAAKIPMEMWFMFCGNSRNIPIIWTCCNDSCNDNTIKDIGINKRKHGKIVHHLSRTQRQNAFVNTYRCGGEKGTIQRQHYWLSFYCCCRCCCSCSYIAVYSRQRTAIHRYQCTRARKDILCNHDIIVYVDGKRNQ